MHAKPDRLSFIFLQDHFIQLILINMPAQNLYVPGRLVFANGKRPQFQICYVVTQILGYQEGVEMLLASCRLVLLNWSEERGMMTS